MEHVICHDVRRVEVLRRGALGVFQMRGHADARGFRLSQEVADYLLRHAERDMPSLLALLDALDRYSLANRRAITVPLLRELLNS